MNRQVIEALEDLAKYYAKAPKARYQMALIVAIDALKSPQPDHITGLVPCGCGGKAQIWPSEPTQFTKVVTDYEAGCTKCAMTTGWVRGKQENAVKVWNTAMGWKGGLEVDDD